jgi:hypothetical protein
MTRTYIPELLVGTIALWVFAWLFPSAYAIQQYVMPTAQNDPAMQLAVANGVLLLAIFLLVGVYCYSIIIEQIILHIGKHAVSLYSHWKKGQKDTL